MLRTRQVAAPAAAVLFVLSCCVSASANTLIVPTNYATIQGAINAADYGDTVIVVEGTYKENLNFKGKAITVRNGDPNQPALVAQTIIDGDGKAPVVTFNHNEGLGSVLSGFTLRNGLGVAIGSFYGGGGIRCQDAYPTISNNVITGNSAGPYGSACTGGGIYCVFTGWHPSSPVITGNTITGNTTGLTNISSGGGAGISGYGVSPTISNNVIASNTTLSVGGGIYLIGGSPVVSGNVFHDNQAFLFTGMGGAGIFLSSCDAAQVSGCVFYGNTGGNDGGGIGCDGGAVSITNCTIAGNTGPGVYLSSTRATLDSNIIVSSANPAGVGVVTWGSAPVAVKFCDVWSNAGGGYENLADPTGTNGNISANPLFANATVHDYHLKSRVGRLHGTAWLNDAVTSPCVDAGDPFLAYSGEPAPHGYCVNMGADGNTAAASKSPSAGSVTVSEQHRSYHSIQGAINAAAAGQTVVAKAGTYHEHLDFLGKAITVRSQDPTDPVVVAATVVDGDASGPVVKLMSSEPASALLSGFTLTNGTGTDYIPGNTLGNYCGGGVCCSGSSPTISHNVITGSTVSGTAAYGGGIYCKGGAPTLADNTLALNQAADGAGIYLSQCTPATVRGCLLRGNWGGKLGGGITISGGAADVASCTISGNVGSGVRIVGATVALANDVVAYSQGSPGGLGIALEQGTAPTVKYCDLWDNTAGNCGGAVGLPDPTGTNGNLAKDPLFANAAAGDFRLKSREGRWNGTAWVRDPASSPLIDTGDPAAAYSLEPSPNGKCLNMGYDGNTAHASKTPTPAVLAWSPKGTSVPVAANVALRFSEAMRHGTVENALYINSVKATSGAFTWVGSSVTYNPAANFTPAKHYAVKLARTAQSVSGAPLAADFTWSFTTGAAAPAMVTAVASPTAAGAQITLSLTAAAQVTVSICNLAGREIAVLQPGQLAAGTQSLLWNGASRTGTSAPAGTYLLQVTARSTDGVIAKALAMLRRQD